MNRKTKFPCGDHYFGKRKELNLVDHIFVNGSCQGRSLTQEELDQAYNPYCQECRISYKWPDNHLLFKSQYKVTFHFLQLSGFKQFIKYLKAAVKAYGILTTIRKLFYDHYNIDSNHTISFPFVKIGYYYLTLNDIRDYYEDLSQFTETTKEKYFVNFNEKDKKLINHQIKVAHRYSRMWEKQLKLKER